MNLSNIQTPTFFRLADDTAGQYFGKAPDSDSLQVISAEGVIYQYSLEGKCLNLKVPNKDIKEILRAPVFSVDLTRCVPGQLVLIRDFTFGRILHIHSADNIEVMRDDKRVTSHSKQGWAWTRTEGACFTTDASNDVTAYFPAESKSYRAYTAGLHRLVQRLEQRLNTSTEGLKKHELDRVWAGMEFVMGQLAKELNSS